MCPYPVNHHNGLITVEIGIDGVGMAAVRGPHESTLVLAQQVRLPHDPQHPLMVNLKALSLQLGRHTPISISGKA